MPQILLEGNLCRLCQINLFVLFALQRIVRDNTVRNQLFKLQMTVSNQFPLLFNFTRRISFLIYVNWMKERLQFWDLKRLRFWQLSVRIGFCLQRCGEIYRNFIKVIVIFLDLVLGIRIHEHFTHWQCFLLYLRADLLFYQNRFL